MAQALLPVSPVPAVDSTQARVPVPQTMLRARESPQGGKARGRGAFLRRVRSLFRPATERVSEPAFQFNFLGSGLLWRWNTALRSSG